MKEKWLLTNKKADYNAVAEKYKISPIVAKLVRNRDIVKDEEYKKYLKGTLEDLYSPWLLKDIPLALDYLTAEIERGGTIAIASDFDDDGIFASLILWTGIRRVGGEAEVFTPDRVIEGYGLNKRIVNEAHEKGITFLLTCDNGIAAFEAISYAKTLGMKVIVTDHHEVPYDDTEQGRIYQLPEADAIVNPKQMDCPYPFKKICGAVVAYKLIEVLYEYYKIEKEDLYELLPYAAIATVADVMDLQDENRIIVKEGLKRLAETKNVGLQELIKACQLNEKKISSYHIGFVIGPCFNAAGRLETVKIALDLLTCKNRSRAAAIAIELKELNESRKEMTLEGTEKAIEQIEREQLYKNPIICVYLKGCHESLVGIIAGRIREKYNHPVYVFTDAEGGRKASGRSIESYNMYAGLIKCKDLLSRFGGHPMAAGLTIPAENYDTFVTRINQDTGLTKDDFVPVVNIDAAMPIQYISDSLIHELELLEPFGKGNPKPLFAEQHFKIHRAFILGKNKNVLRMQVENRSGYGIEAIYFGNLEEFWNLVQENFGVQAKEDLLRGNPNSVDMAFTYYPTINEFRGNCTLQIVVQNYCVIVD
ncbi:MAG: single-stranded-DNA-specific exonuclease RecJ [Lachnospiraceae bacterium]